MIHIQAHETFTNCMYPEGSSTRLTRMLWLSCFTTHDVVIQFTKNEEENVASMQVTDRVRFSLQYTQ